MHGVASIQSQRQTIILYSSLHSLVLTRSLDAVYPSPFDVLHYLNGCPPITADC